MQYVVQQYGYDKCARHIRAAPAHHPDLTAISNEWYVVHQCYLEKGCSEKHCRSQLITFDYQWCPFEIIVDTCVHSNKGAVRRAAVWV